jgi:succinate dehydrogenase/fumarate reductase flavoprotein subunit
LLDIVKRLDIKSLKPGKYQDFDSFSWILEKTKVGSDIVVVGGGCAGMVAALEAEANGASVRLLDRGPIGIGTNSVLSNGIFAGPNVHCPYDEYIRDTLDTGKGLNRNSLVRLVAREAPRTFSFLNSLGLELTDFSGRLIVKSPRPDILPGLTLVKALVKKIKDAKRIQVLTGVYVTDILRDDEKVSGVKGFGKEGEEVSLHAPAVVLATGGAGGIYLRNDNQKNIMGQGYSLAAKAGLPLWDMEFVQFFPLVMAEPSLPSQTLFSPHPKETRLLNNVGEEILQKYNMPDLNEVVKTRRDEFSAILFKEGLKGQVYIDYREAPASCWERHPLSLLRKIKFDSPNKVIAISPAAHFFMGGVRTDEDGKTSLPGFFACGEVVWGLHGANRMSGNALSEAVVFGRIAGKNAAQYAFTHGTSPARPHDLPNSWPHQRTYSHEMLRPIRREIKEIAWRYAGVVRSEEEIKDGFTKALEAEEKLNGIIPQTASERRLREDLISAAFVFKAVLTASLSRRESRGSFIRDDFPQIDEINYCKNSCLAYDRKQETLSCNFEVVES